MTLFLLHTPTTTHFTKLATAAAISCSSSKPPHKKPHHLHQQQQKQQVLAARDRIIDFGRHKGKPLGSLPSTYLKWVCRNLRAGDSLHWAELADQVLRDPVYKDRIEWELAENLLTGNTNMAMNESETVVSRLVEVSETFGWDNEDKVAWSKVDFELLGTSKGGRIPRKVEGRMGKQEKEEERIVMSSESEERRRQRRMRRVRDKMVITNDIKGRFGNGEMSGGHDDDDDGDQDRTVEIKSPFPGRGALLKKVLSSRRFL